MNFQIIHIKKVIKRRGSFLLVAVILFFTTCKKEKPDLRSNSFIAIQPSKNQPPVANAGLDQTVFLPQDTAVLNGTLSNDPDGRVIKYFWSKLSGPPIYGPVNMVHADSSVLTIKFITLGEYAFQLQVTDDKGITSRDTVNVMLKNNPAPAHIVKAKVLEYGSDLPIAGANLAVCTSIIGNNGCGAGYLGFTTDANGDCFFYANKFLYGDVLKDGYFRDIHMPCFNTYFRNGILMNLNENYHTADSFVVRIVPKTDFILHITDSSLRGPVEGNYLTADVSFGLCGIGGLLGASLRKGIDTTIRFSNYYGNANYVFTLGYELNDGGFPMHVLKQQQKFIAKGNNSTLNIIY